MTSYGRAPSGCSSHLTRVAPGPFLGGGRHASGHPRIRGCGAPLLRLAHTPSLHQVLQRVQNIKTLDWPRFTAAAMLSIQPPLRSESLDEEGGAFTPQQGKGNQLPQ